MAGTHTQYLQETFHIAYILQRLRKERVLLHVRPPNMDRSFNSALLDVDTPAQRLVLDELNPYEGHQVLNTGDTVHVHARIDGVNVHFDVPLAAIEYERNIALYRTPFPAEVIYRQRRRHFRAMLNDSEFLPIVLPLQAQQEINGRLVDISISGLCSRLEHEDAQQLHTAQAIHAAQINLPGRGSIRCDLAVRCLRSHPAYTLVGTEIIAIEPRSRHTLERFIASQGRARQRRLRL